MASQGVNTQDFIKFAAEESGNVRGDGMFSIQVWFVVRMHNHNAGRSHMHCQTVLRKRQRSTLQAKTATCTLGVRG